jgi:LAGLIDADG-like domain
LWADGHLNRQGTKSAVKLTLTDEDAVKKATEVTGARYHSYPQRPPRKTVHVTQFGDRPAVERLVNIGFGDKPLAWPMLPHPASFLRGAFDGDGAVIWHQQGGRRKTVTTPLRLHTTLCGTALFLEGVQEFLAARAGISPKTISYHNGIWRVQWNHSDSLRLAGAIYSEDGPRMDRKYLAFHQEVR